MGLSIGGWEVLLILIIALILWGPGKLPEIARTLGKITRGLKKAGFDLTSAVTSEIEKDTEAKNTQSPSTETKTEESDPNADSVANKKQDNQTRTREGQQP
jgi:sec-independent protein translocase protein TatA